MQEQRPEDSYLPAITGLRGVAASWVLLFHAWQFAGAAPLRVLGIDLTPLLACGYFGVDLFFVLSGFLLGMPFIAARQRGERLSLGRFWRNRARRVLPAYWTQLVILIALAAASGVPSFSVATLAGHFGLAFNLMQNHSEINPVYWSLPVEWDFYLLLPVLALPFRGGRSVLLTLVAGVALVIGFRWLCVAGLQWWGGDGIPLYRWIIQIPGRLDQFLFGMAAAWCLLKQRPRLAWLGLCSGSAIVLAMCWGAAARGDFITLAVAPWVIGHYTGVGLGFSLLLLATVWAPRAWPSRLLASRPLAWLGMISYSLYLWHYPLLQWQRGWWPETWAGPLGVGLTLPLILFIAWASYWGVERPFLGRKARRAERADPAKSNTPAIAS